MTLLDERHYQPVQRPGDGRPMSPQEARQLARAFLDGGASLEEARPAIERLILICGDRRVHAPPAPQLAQPSTLGVDAVRKLKAGRGAELHSADVVGVYLFAYAASFGCEDPEFVGSRRAFSGAQARALTLVRGPFGGSAEAAARYAARAVRFWRRRAQAERWPGPAPARFTALCDERLLACWRSGEIDREVAR